MKNKKKTLTIVTFVVSIISIIFLTILVIYASKIIAYEALMAGMEDGYTVCLLKETDEDKQKCEENYKLYHGYIVDKLIENKWYYRYVKFSARGAEFILEGTQFEGMFSSYVND